MVFFKSFIFVLFFFLFGSSSCEIYLTQANLVGQSVEVLVEGGANSSILVTKPNGESFSKELDQFGQTKIFLDQPGVWTFSYQSYSKTLYVRDKVQQQTKHENYSQNLFLIGFFIIVIISILLIYFFYMLYKNMGLKEPSLFMKVSGEQIGIVFQASKDVLEDVELKIELKENPIIITRKKLLPFEKISYFCPNNLFLNASVRYKIGQESFSISLEKEGKSATLVEKEASLQSPIKKEKKKLKRVN